MRKHLSVLVAGAAMLVLLSGIATAAPSFLGTSGNILTPDDSVLGVGDFSANYHSLQLSDTVSVLGANFGVTDNLEVGLSRLDSDREGADAHTLINAKYAIMPERVNAPSAVIGVLDASGDADPDNDPSLYVVFGKNLTPAATGLAGEPVRPIRGYLGFGSGIYKGLFLGADWAFTPNAKLMVEFLNEVRIKDSLSEKSVFNAGVRFALTDSLRGDVALINAEDLGVGISFNKLIK